ncbi:MAG: hypothetical protein Fur0022_11300 [Anaerolineales bacterium]
MVVAIIFVLTVLGFFFQTGKATEKNPTFLPVQNNSPEAILRGIEFNPEMLIPTGSGEEYGYQIDDSVPFSWKDPSGATPVVLSNPDDGFAGPIPLGFVFPFYENTYSEVYISANGYISFETMKDFAGDDAENLPIPYEVVPNNFVAPFWSDLAVGGEFNDGEVSTMQGSDSNGQYFAVTYLNVSKRLLINDLLSFQIILYQNGDIYTQYSAVSGDLSATIGIEDGDGLSGVQYPALLTNGLAIRYQRPGDTARVKLLSTLESGLTQSGARDYVVFIRNTGEVGADRYNISLLKQAPGVPEWSINLYDADDNPLIDTNSDGIQDTGLISQGDTISFTVRVLTPPAALVGDYSDFTLTAASVLDPNKTDEMRFLTAIPSRHFIAFGNSGGLDLGRITTDRQIIFDVTSLGDRPALILTNNQYFYAWEDDDFIPGTDIQYAILGYGGNPIQPVTRLTENTDPLLNVRDTSVALAVSANNRVGVVWIRRIIDVENPTLGENYNVFWAILDTNGNILLPPTNITNNGPCDDEPEVCWHNGINIDVPVYSTPSIMVTEDNRFFITWLDKRILPGGDVTDIGYVIYDTDGNLLRQVDDLKNGNTGQEIFNSPRLLRLPNERVLVTYSVTDPITLQESPEYGVYSTSPDSLGDEIQGDVLFDGVEGRNIDTTLLTNARILVAWTDTVSEQIEYTILTDDGSLVSTPLQYFSLPTPDNRASNFVSVAATTSGQGILSWIDGDVGNRVYYALVGSNGEIITPATIAWEGDQPYSVSQSAQGIVPIPDWYIRLPIVKKN